jgi:excinuclease ABC subunit A
MASPVERDAPPIRVVGARTHNLKNLDVTLPSQGIVALTGPSGSGKSSLAFDTIYAEAQRRFVESLRVDARQALRRLPAPEVDLIEGLSPAIAIEQRALARAPRSTLGTATEISDHLRLLFARLGQANCPKCGKLLVAETPQEIVDGMLGEPAGTKLVVTAPIVRATAGDLARELAALRADGFVRAFVDGALVDLGEVEALDPRRFPAPAHDLDAVIDRLVVKDDARARDALRVRASDSVELAFKRGGGRLHVQRERPGEPTTTSFHSDRASCERDDVTLPPIVPRLFSPNAREGACPSCEGLGVARDVDPTTFVREPALTLRRGAMAPWGSPGSVAYALELDRAVSALGIDPDLPFAELDEADRAALFDGRSAPLKKGKKKGGPYEGVVAWVRDRLASNGADDVELEEGALEPAALTAFTREVQCPSCGGSRLRPEASWVRLAGRTITEVGAMDLPGARRWTDDVAAVVPPSLARVGAALLPRVRARLEFLVEVGLHYLSIDRALPTMSAGEVARIRLATQLGGGLRGVLHVIDEPSAGLHARDVRRLTEALTTLAREGNGLLVVDHDLAVIRAADHVADIGPGAGARGGELLAQGTVDEVSRDPRSVTGPYLSGAARLPIHKRKPVDRDHAIGLERVRLHNLVDVDATIPLGVLVAVTGPSGSGKSSLIIDTLLPAMERAIAARGRAHALPPHLGKLTGAAAIDKVIAIDDAPLGRSPKSNAASYVELLPRLRDYFASLPEARTRGYTASRFSANVKGGRCEACRGEGAIRVELSFLPDVWVPCEVCKGARYSRETLEIKAKGRSIADVLALSVDEAEPMFAQVTPIAEKLRALHDVGLGYLPLGQPATTLSGGEAQRVKLARELSRRATGRTLFVLDEPTTGLHPTDVAVLLDALFALRDQGNSVVIVEHDLDVAARADWVIDLGPDAGAAGGCIVAAGLPEEVAACAESATAPFLREAIERLRPRTAALPK